MRLSSFSLIALTTLTLTLGCGQGEQAAQTEPAAEPAQVTEAAPAPPAATEPVMVDTSCAAADFAFGEGLDAATGTVAFQQIADGEVLVSAELTGIEPGMHGFHLHTKGDCSAGDFTTTGGHFNPTDVDHGGPDALVHHAGDFGNIEVADDGTAQFELVAFGLTVNPGPLSVQHRAVILHAGQDDLETQPTGAAGARLGCALVVPQPADSCSSASISSAASTRADAYRAAAAAAAAATTDEDADAS